MDKDSFEYLCENPTRHNILMASVYDALKWLVLYDNPTWYIKYRKNVYKKLLLVSCEVGNLEFLKLSVNQIHNLSEVMFYKIMRNLIDKGHHECADYLLMDNERTKSWFKDVLSLSHNLRCENSYNWFNKHSDDPSNLTYIEFLSGVERLGIEYIVKFPISILDKRKEPYVHDMSVKFIIRHSTLEMVLYTEKKWGLYYGGRDLLEYAAEFSPLDIFKYICSKFDKLPSMMAHVNTLEKAKMLGRKPTMKTFMNACISGDLEFVKWSSDVKRLTEGFDYCCKNDRTDIVSYLLERGVLPTNRNFIDACKYGHLETAKLIYREEFVVEMLTKFHYINEWLLSFKPDLRKYIARTRKIVSPNVYNNHGFMVIFGEFYEREKKPDEEKYYHDIRMFRTRMKKKAISY